MCKTYIIKRTLGDLLKEKHLVLPGQKLKHDKGSIPFLLYPKPSHYFLEENDS